MPRPRLLARQIFGPYCPSGGTWYVCTSGSKFVGCCNNEPCSLGCKDGNIEPASFDPSYYGQFPDLSCESGSRFYTCASASPTHPFWGCCKSNPCNGGCSGNLTPASLTGTQALDCQYNVGGCDAASSSPTSSETVSSTTSSAASSAFPSTTSESSTSSSTTSESSTSTSTTLSGAATSSTSTSSSQPSAATSLTTVSHASTGAIAGGSVAGVAGLAFIILLIFYCYRHAARSRKKRNHEVGAQLHSRQPSALTAKPPFTPETKHIYQEPDSPPSSTFKPPNSPSHPPLSPTLPLYIPPSPTASNPHSTPHHSHHNSYELPAISVAQSPTGLGIYSPRASSPGISRRPVPTSPNPSELSAEEVQRRAELSSTDSVRWSPNLSHTGAGGQSPRSAWTASSGVGVAASEQAGEGSGFAEIDGGGAEIDGGGAERRNWGRAP